MRTVKSKDIAEYVEREKKKITALIMVGGQKHLTFISKASHIKNHEQSFPKEDRIKENEHKLQEELF